MSNNPSSDVSIAYSLLSVDELAVVRAKFSLYVLADDILWVVRLVSDVEKVECGSGNDIGWVCSGSGRFSGVTWIGLTNDRFVRRDTVISYEVDSRFCFSCVEIIFI